MKKFNLMFVALLVSLTVLVGIAFQQKASANEQGQGCGLLTHCTGSESCGGRGDVDKCNITCEGTGTVISCPPVVND